MGGLKARDVHGRATCRARPMRSALTTIGAELPLRVPDRCVYHAFRAGRGLLGLRKLPPLEDVPLELPHGGLRVHQPQRLACSKGIPGRVPQH